MPGTASCSTREMRRETIGVASRLRSIEARPPSGVRPRSRTVPPRPAPRNDHRPLRLQEVEGAGASGGGTRGEDRGGDRDRTDESAGPAIERHPKHEHRKQDREHRGDGVRGGDVPDRIEPCIVADHHVVDGRSDRRHGHRDDRDVGGHHEACGDAGGDAGGRGRRGEPGPERSGRDDAGDRRNQEAHRGGEEERLDDAGVVQRPDHRSGHAGAGHHRPADRSGEFTHAEPGFDSRPLGHPAEHQHAESGGEGREGDERESDTVSPRIVRPGRPSIDHGAAEVVDVSTRGVRRVAPTGSRAGIGNDVGHRSIPWERRGSLTQSFGISSAQGTRDRGFGSRSPSDVSVSRSSSVRSSAFGATISSTA